MPKPAEAPKLILRTATVTKGGRVRVPRLVLEALKVEDQEELVFVMSPATEGMVLLKKLDDAANEVGMVLREALQKRP
ncbi:MAG TPA: hypothetical protein VGG32_01030 [Thermoplasmata archaeon]|jgi:bifunctional DNA-binding transcriptional regulator/antitoxin component of YhaV-PrlF toxin-antitoxin module